MAKTYVQSFMSRFRQPMKRIATEMTNEGEAMKKDLAAVSQTTALPPAEVMAAVKSPSEHPETVAAINRAGAMGKAKRLRRRTLRVASLKREAQKAATEAAAGAVVEVTSPEREAPDVHDLERMTERVTDIYPIPELLEGTDEIIE